MQFRHAGCVDSHLFLSVSYNICVRAVFSPFIGEWRAAAIWAKQPAAKRAYHHHHHQTAPAAQNDNVKERPLFFATKKQRYVCVVLSLVCVFAFALRLVGKSC